MNRYWAGLLIVFSVVCVNCGGFEGASVLAEDPVEETSTTAVELQPHEQAFVDQMSNSVLVGYFTLAD